MSPLPASPLPRGQDVFPQERVSEPSRMTPFALAQRYVGIKEMAGNKDHPLILWWLSLCGLGDGTHDETPWCSAFVNGMAWELRLPRSKSAAARSWLGVGLPVRYLTEARPGHDIVIFWRGEKDGPFGHVGFFAGVEGTDVLVLGGNQNDQVSIARYPAERLLGIRRLTATES
jgi:uncharacterized protein (TIGR02594 family)